nr:MAG TPA: hypothetical protein [Caudoviricetes sp.]
MGWLFFARKVAGKLVFCSDGRAHNEDRSWPAYFLIRRIYYGIRK